MVAGGSRGFRAATPLLPVCGSPVVGAFAVSGGGGEIRVRAFGDAEVVGYGAGREAQRLPAAAGGGDVDDAAAGAHGGGGGWRCRRRSGGRTRGRRRGAWRPTCGSPSATP